MQRLRLQWGHALTRVETDLSLLAQKGMMLLQWGHALTRVETSQPLRGGNCGLCFNGATR